MNHDECAVILPARNEAGAVEEVVKAFRAIGARVVVVDNASNDQTQSLAAEAGAEVAVEPNIGYGSACLRGIQHLHLDPPEIVAFADCDGTVDAVDLLRVVEPLRSGSADLVLGRRVHVEPGAFPRHQRIGNRLVLALLNRLTKAALNDIPPLRAIRFDALRTLGLRSTTYGFPVETVTAAAARGFRIREVDVSYRRRRTGRSKVSGSLPRSVAAGGIMLNTVVRAWRRGRRRLGTIVVFARAPELGRVKTRMEALYPAPVVLTLYRAMLRDTLRAARLAGAHVVLSHTKAPAFEEQGLADEVMEQCGESFRERFDDALARARRATTSGPLMILGADTPHLPPALIREALLEASNGSVVVGPAPRGGFYALAFPGDPLRVGDAFDATDQVEALRRIVAAGRLRLRTMPEWFDLDEPHDLEQLARTPRTADQASWPATRALLANPQFSGPTAEAAPQGRPPFPTPNASHSGAAG